MHVMTAGGLVPMARSGFESEALLQELLADNPDLMPGELVDPLRPPRRWLLITREAGIALVSDDGGGSRWSLDHLFVDQDGTPTLVEVKRASDTRGRREVVAQMLDYAASLSGWGPGRISEVFVNRCVRGGADSDELLLAFVEPETDLASFWERVDTNLAGGRIRLVFLSDLISPELRQIIEFLNSQFVRAEVLGIEVKQWQGEGVTALVSDVIGRTSAAAAAKGQTQTPSRITEAEFKSMLNEADSTVAATIRALMSWCLEHGGFVTYGTGRSWPACYLNWKTATGTSIWPLIPTLPSYVSVPFDGLATRTPFDDDALREELRRRLSEIDGITLAEDAIGRRPSFPFAAISTPDALKQLFEVLRWFVETIRPPSGVSSPA